MVANNYLKGVTKQYKSYTEEQYVPALGNLDTDPETLLAALRYVETRNVQEHESRLREIFTSRHPRRLRDEIHNACLDALIATTEDPVGTARFLALVATVEEPQPTTRLAERGLQRLLPSANEALLTELNRPHAERRLRRLVRLLIRLSDTQPPVPIPFSQDVDDAQRKTAVEKWRTRIRARGGL